MKSLYFDFFQRFHNVPNFSYVERFGRPDPIWQRVRGSCVNASITGSIIGQLEIYWEKTA